MSLNFVMAVQMMRPVVGRGTSPVARKVHSIGDFPVDPYLNRLLSDLRQAKIASEETK
jgi:hypothetical protein